MLSVPTIYNKRKLGILPRKRFKRKRCTVNKDTKIRIGVDFEEFTKAIAQYLAENEITFNAVRDLIVELDTSFTESYKTSKDSDDSDRSDASEIDEMYVNIRDLMEKVNVGNGKSTGKIDYYSNENVQFSVILTIDEKTALVSVTNNLLRSNNVDWHLKQSIMNKLMLISNLLNAINFLKPL